MKLIPSVREMVFVKQPPSGGCVLKQGFGVVNNVECRQPPSGGCVLKPSLVKDGKCVKSSRLQAAVC